MGRSHVKFRTAAEVWIRAARFVGALLLTAGVVATSIPAWSQGLKLDSATEKEVDQYDKPNPHFELACTECHDGTPDPKKDTVATVKFINGEEGNVKLCYNCHDASENLHPINVDPATATPKIKVPAGFPLERLGAHKGTVVCTTCHFIHTKTAGLKLLRGFPESSDPEDVKKAIYKDRRDFCRGCHGDGLKDKSPHKGKIAGGKTCSFCHGVEPKEGEKVQLNKNIVQVCDFCHAATKGAHYLMVNPFADPNLKAEIAQANLPLVGGEYVCISCHNPHGGTGEEKFLRKEFVVLALKSTRVRPHYMKAFCEACHSVRPILPKGAPGAQKLAEIPLRDADPNKLCNRCHESGLSKANAHPIRVVPESFKANIPQGWPLTADGSLSCMTCHTAGDSPTYDPKNENFLRGAPYETRNSMCWKCHSRDEFSKLNPHADINEGKGCEFCHATRPDPKKSKEQQDVKFKGDIVLLCIRCHDDSPHPAGIDHTGLKTPERLVEVKVTMPKSFPLDHRGRVTCATCHDPHAGGDQRGDLGMTFCSNCHAF